MLERPREAGGPQRALARSANKLSGAVASPPGSNGRQLQKASTTHGLASAKRRESSGCSSLLQSSAQASLLCKLDKMRQAQGRATFGWGFEQRVLARGWCNEVLCLTAPFSCCCLQQLRAGRQSHEPLGPCQAWSAAPSQLLFMPLKRAALPNPFCQHASEEQVQPPAAAALLSGGFAPHPPHGWGGGGKPQQVIAPDFVARRLPCCLHPLALLEMMLFCPSLQPSLGPKRRPSKM